MKDEMAWWLKPLPKERQRKVQEELLCKMRKQLRKRKDETMKPGEIKYLEPGEQIKEPDYGDARKKVLSHCPWLRRLRRMLRERRARRYQEEILRIVCTEPPYELRPLEIQIGDEAPFFFILRLEKF
jgi:hypothetical protein